MNVLLQAGDHNEGLTKAALRHALDYIIGQFGPRWAFAAIAETLRDVHPSYSSPEIEQAAALIEKHIREKR